MRRSIRALALIPSEWVPMDTCGGGTAASREPRDQKPSSMYTAPAPARTDGFDDRQDEASGLRGTNRQRSRTRPHQAPFPSPPDQDCQGRSSSRGSRDIGAGTRLARGTPRPRAHEQPPDHKDKPAAKEETSSPTPVSTTHTISPRQGASVHRVAHGTRMCTASGRACGPRRPRDAHAHRALNWREPCSTNRRRLARARPLRHGCRSTRRREPIHGPALRPCRPPAGAEIRASTGSIVIPQPGRAAPGCASCPSTRPRRAPYGSSSSTRARRSPRDWCCQRPASARTGSARDCCLGDR
jgi:hypothetical protein